MHAQANLKARVPTAPPRRSRRLAGAGVEFSVAPEPARCKKRVMRTLNVIQENEGISTASLEEYAKLFAQPLSEEHLFALACLFGWRSPDERVKPAPVSAGM